MYDSIHMFFWTSAVLFGVLCLCGIIALKRMVCRMHAQRNTWKAKPEPKLKELRPIKVNGRTYYK